MSIIYKAILTIKQVKPFLTCGVRYIWMVLALLLGEPLVVPEDICQYTLSRILISMMLISWWISAFLFCEYPSLTDLLFLIGGLLKLLNILTLDSHVRSSVPPSFSAIGYANVLFIDIEHLDNILHATHFGSHTILLLVAIYSVMALEPRVHSIKENHQLICFAEMIAHGLMGVFESAYWLLVIQNLVEYFEHKGK